MCVREGERGSQRERYKELVSVSVSEGAEKRVCVCLCDKESNESYVLCGMNNTSTDICGTTHLDKLYVNYVVVLKVHQRIAAIQYFAQ